eukprot:14486665-Alexandrium_andersonii.AAC.1
MAVSLAPQRHPQPRSRTPKATIPPRVGAQRRAGAAPAALRAVWKTRSPSRWSPELPSRDAPGCGTAGGTLPRVAWPATR